MGSVSTYRFFNLWRAIGVALVIGAVTASLLPLPFRISAHHLDKLWHGLTYACMMFWFVQLYGRSRNWILALGFIGLGILVEGLQSLTGYRTAEVADAVANSIGVAVGWGLFQTPLGRTLAWLDRLLARGRGLPES